MLVLQRKVDEAIVVGNGLVRIVVTAIRGNSVRLGIEAPKELSVHRDEIQRTINDRSGDE